MSRLNNVTIRQLRALGAVAATGSVTGAAARLHLTQPAVTLQLRNLQNLAGLPLLQRTNDGMIPTGAGHEVLGLLERIEAEVASCATSLDMIAGHTGGRVAIGAVSTAKYFAPFAIAAFSKLYPKVEIILKIGNRQELREALRGYELDIAIMGRSPAEIPVETHLIGDNPHIIIAPKGHRLEHECNLAPTDLSHERFLTREQGSGTRLLMEQLFEINKFQPVIGMEMSSNETIKQAVAAGLGIAFISAHTVAMEIEDGRLVMLDVAGLPVVRQWFVVRRSDKMLLPPAQAMLDFFAAEGAKFLPKAPQKRLVPPLGAKSKGKDKRKASAPKQPGIEPAFKFDVKS